MRSGRRRSSPIRELSFGTTLNRLDADEEVLPAVEAAYAVFREHGLLNDQLRLLLHGGAFRCRNHLPGPPYDRTS